MDTASEWIHILVAGGIFGILTLMWDAFTRRDSFTKWPNLAITALISLAWGMMFILGWRVLHGVPLGLFTVIVIGLIGVGLIERHNCRRKSSRQD